MNNRWKVNFRLLWGGHFLAVFSSMVIAPMLPFYMEELGAEDQASVLLWSGLSLAAPAVSAALTAPLWGRLGDLTSRKWMVVRALFGSSLVLAAMAFVDTPMQLFILRFLQGALGGVVDAVGAFAASEAQKQEQGRVRGKLEGALAAGSMLGPLLGGIAFGTIGFRSLFVLSSILLALWTVLSYIGLKETRRETIVAVQSAGMGKQFTLLLRERKVILFLIAGILANFGIHGLLTVLPLHVKTYVGDASDTAVWVGILQAINWAAVWCASSWWGSRNDSYPVERNFIIASALCGVAILLQAFAPSIYWLVIWRVLQGFASSALVQSVFLIVTRTSLADQLGSRIGMTRSILFFGQIAGPLVSGLSGNSIHTAMLFTLHGSVIITSGLLIGLFVRGNKASERMHKQQKREAGL